MKNLRSRESSPWQRGGKQVCYPLCYAPPSRNQEIFLQYGFHQYWMGSINYIELCKHCPVLSVNTATSLINCKRVLWKTPEPWLKLWPAGREAWMLPLCYADTPGIRKFLGLSFSMNDYGAFFASSATSNCWLMVIAINGGNSSVSNTSPTRSHSNLMM